MIRPGAVLLLIFAACSADLGSGAAGPTRLCPHHSRPSDTGPPPLDHDAEAPRALLATTTSTVPWASVRLDDENPVEAAIPVRIEIVVIDLEAPILPLGVVSETGQMEVPENVDQVGWYRYGPAPGRPGSAVLAAHVDMAGEGPGVFFHLDRLRMGDQVNVDFDDGTTSTFVVSHAERVPKGELELRFGLLTWRTAAVAVDHLRRGLQSNHSKL